MTLSDENRALMLRTTWAPGGPIPDPLRVTRDELNRLLDAAREEGRSGGGEPVAWQVKIEGLWGETSDPEHWRARGFAVRALYAAPSPPLRVGVEERLRAMATGAGPVEVYGAILTPIGECPPSLQADIRAILSALSEHSRVRDSGSSRDLSPAVCSALEGWQPIETAPKDGTLFLAWRTVPTFDEDTGKSTDAPEPCIAQVLFGDVASIPLHYMPQGQRIIHWMPIHAPPSGGDLEEPRSVGGQVPGISKSPVSPTRQGGK